MGIPQKCYLPIFYILLFAASRKRMKAPILSVVKPLDIFAFHFSWKRRETITFLIRNGLRKASSRETGSWATPEEEKGSAEMSWGQPGNGSGKISARISFPAAATITTIR